MNQCPDCKKMFNELYTVPSNSLEPFTAVDAMKGLQAWGTYDAPKVIICQVGSYVHFQFVNGNEERLVKIEKFDQDHLTLMHQHYMDHLQVCGHEDCDAPGVPCYYNWTDETPAGYYCSDHCFEEGFCQGCGLFNAGFESFDFSEDGMCESCHEQIESEFDDWDDYEPDFEDDYEDEWEMPTGGGDAF